MEREFIEVTCECGHKEYREHGDFDPSLDYQCNECGELTTQIDFASLPD
jgi:hypothetical protein